jgi:hypothetical protein
MKTPNPICNLYHGDRDSKREIGHNARLQVRRALSRENAAALHVIQEVPSLRIVDDALWQRVKMRQENLRAG